MLYSIKVAVSAIPIVPISEIAGRSTLIGGLVASLPLAIAATAISYAGLLQHLKTVGIKP